MGIFGNEKESGSANAVDVLRAQDSAALHDALLAGVRRGWLVSLGRSRDGFAVSLAVLDGGEVSRVWCDKADALETALQRLLTAATDLDGEPPSARPRKPRKPR